MSDSPTNYNPKIPRVSQIVEFFYPFVWESKDRFHSWLKRHNISLADYMEEASKWGTYVHLAMETYWNKWKWGWKKYKEIVDNWIQFHIDYDVKTIWSEVYVKCRHYQWTADRVAILQTLSWEKWLLDWKTYWLAKYKFWVEGAYRKPYDKLKKARLQLSLYARLLWIKNIAVVELDRDNYHFHKLELIEEKEIQELLLLYNNHFIDEI